MSNGVAQLYSWASQAGDDIGEEVAGAFPSGDVVRRAIRRRLESATLDKRRSRVARIGQLMGSAGGPVDSVRVYALCSFLCRASVTAAEFVDMDSCKWGQGGSSFDQVSSLPLGLRDLVGWSVLSHRDGKIHESS